MENFVNCRSCQLEDGSYYLEEVSLPQGTISALYLGTGSVYAVVSPQSDYMALYKGLRDTLGVLSVHLYVTEKGHFTPHEDTLQDPLSREELLEEIADCISRPPTVISPSRLQSLQNRLVEVDAYTRGHCRDQEGRLYLLKNGAFRMVSETNPEHFFWLTLLGGCMGLHRFALGKFASGMAYLLTCGIFLVGWLLDLLQLFLGLWKDREERLILPPVSLGRKIFLCIPGICLSILFISLYFRLCDVFLFRSTPSLTIDFEPLRAVLQGIEDHIL